MKLLDTNVFLRHITGVRASTDTPMVAAADGIFAAAASGSDVFTTSEAVIAEIVFVLSSPRTYGLSRSEIRDRLAGILTAPGCKIERADAMVHALEIWENSPALKFVDAIIIAIAEFEQQIVVTFDDDLAKAAGTRRWDIVLAGGGNGAS